MHYSPENPFRAFFFHIIKFRLFDPFIMLCIILNIVTMSMAYETQSREQDYFLKQINLTFMIVFIVEAVFKLLAFGIRGYFKSGWNQFDFFVVVSSIVDFVMLNTNQRSLQGLSAGP